MRLLRLAVMLSALVGLTAAQSQCDPLTQYAKLGECCNMCGPGTSMTSLGTCLQPQCQSCDENEYQDKYTKDPKCQRQPYCDPNRNFDIPVHHNKKRSTCLCKKGYHCATKECYICVQHTTCKAGQWVKSRGNPSADTVCEKCPKGTFSDGNSSEVCTNWTECENGLIVHQKGTDVSNNICGPAFRNYVILIVVFVMLVVAVAVAVLIWFLKCKGKHGKANIKSCVDYLGEKGEQLKEDKLLDAASANHNQEMSMLHECSQDTDAFPRTPEENVHEPSQATQEVDSGSMSDLGLTDNGNYVKQEMGKTERLSRQESQTQNTTL